MTDRVGEGCGGEGGIHYNYALSMFHVSFMSQHTLNGRSKAKSTYFNTKSGHKWSRVIALSTRTRDSADPNSDWLRTCLHE